MNSGFPPSPDDDANDPLLAALRQRLSGYGEAPPPAAWAAIRQQLPPPPAGRPGWRRRPLVLLLALLLMVSGTLMVRQGWLKPGGKPNPAVPGPLAAGSAAKHSLTPGSFSATTSSKPASAPTAPTLAAPASVIWPLPRATAAAPTRRPASLLATTTGTAPALPLASAGGYRATRPTRPHRLAALATSKYAAPARQREHQAGFRFAPGSPSSGDRSATRAATTSSRRLAAWRAGRPGYSYRAPLGARLPSSAITKQRQYHRAAMPLAVSWGHASAHPTHQLAIDSLSLKPVAVSVSAPAAALPGTLTGRPTGAGHPAEPAARRWSLLLLAGPTLSYRTLGPSPLLPASRPDFARLERPALGLGAQVQARRVLAGRWALAAGLGYHEYATQLAVKHHDSATTAVHQRDTYRLLTLPVQLSYALAAPRGRLAWAVLAGAEPGWYQGGRSTEGSTCSCQQQAYSAASLSPYRSWSVAFSFGLDLRYQLGGPASRWHLVVQPTGRYVATPFVRSEAGGYTARQPFSLGLLTGFSWDVR